MAPELCLLSKSIWKGKRSLPFLPPHLRQLKTAQEQVVPEMLPSVGYESSIGGAWPQSLEQLEASLDKKQLSWKTWAWGPYHESHCLVDRHDENIGSRKHRVMLEPSIGPKR